MQSQSFLTIRRPQIHILVLLALSIVLCSSSAHSFAQTNTSSSSISQRRINEAAAAVLNVQLNMSNITALKRSGESPVQYSKRLDSYFQFFDKASGSIGLIVNGRPSQNNSAANLAIWDRIRVADKNLATNIEAAKKYRREDETKGGTSRLGKSLMSTLQTLRIIYRELRDAEP